MKFKLNRFVSLGLAVIMTASTLVGCGSTDDKKTSSSASSSASVSSETKESTQQSSASAASSSEVASSTEEKTGITFPLAETVEYTAMARLYQNEYLLSENVTWKWLQEQANIKIDLVQEFPRNEAAEKGKLVIAGGDYPEILWKMDCLDLNSYGMEGLLLPLEDLIKENMPNLSAWLDERDAWKDITCADGHIYHIPQILQSEMNSGHSNSVWWINERWLKNVGMDMPTSMDELYEVLKAFKEKDANGNGDANDEIPITFSGDRWDSFLAYIGDGVHFVGNHVTIQNDELVFYPYTDGYKDLLKMLAKMFAEGLIDKNALTQTDDQMRATTQSGDVAGMVYNTAAHYVTQEAYHKDFVALTPFNWDNAPLSKGIQQEAMALTDICENPEIILAWVDYLYTEKGSWTALLGVEGETYKDNGDGTYSTTVDKEKYGHLAAYALHGAASTPCARVASYYTGDATLSGNPGKAAEVGKYAPDGVYSKGTLIPSLSYTEEEREKRSGIYTDLDGYINNYSAQVIAGEVVLEDTWNEFQDNLKKMKADDYLKIMQAAYERTK